MKTSQNAARRKRAAILIGGLALLSVVVIFLVGVVIKAGIEIAGDLSDGSTTGTTTTGTALTTTTTKPADKTIQISTPLSCSGAIIYDESADQVVYTLNADETCYPASLTKLLTAITALKHCEESQVFTVGSELSMLLPNSSIAGLKKGNKLTLTMLLDAMLVPSGNDAAYTIAVGVARLKYGDSLTDKEAVAKFAELMNQTAADIGAKNSHFSVPDGYYRKDHYSTPSDLLLITKAAMELPAIRASVAKPSARCLMLSGQDVTWQNTNPLIKKKSDYYMASAIGIKTGYTVEGGYCAAVAASENGNTVIAVLVNAPSNEDRWMDATVLLEAGLGKEK